MFHGKTIIVGVTGGIAAYKSCDLVSSLKKLGADVWVVMTKEAAELVTPLTFRTLSGNLVITSLFSEDLSTIPVPHIALTDQADLFIIAPCTANVIGKLANGIADDPLTTMAMACPKLKILAPAMNNNMWTNQAVLENVQKLSRMNYELIGPEVGRLACGTNDIGRMSEPEDIIRFIARKLNLKQDFSGRQILVTAGGTREAIDAVRYISNRSSGKMGYALAKAARERGAKVTLVSSSNLPAPLDISPVKVESADEMLEAVLDYYNQSDTVVMSAAVADFKYVAANFSSPSSTHGGLKTAATKIKKTKQTLQLQLEPTQDILAMVSKQKNRKDKTLVGFALETDDLIANAKKKLKEKDLDLIVANDPSTFDGEQIKYSIIDRKGAVSEYPRQPKDQAAHVILNHI